MAKAKTAHDIALRALISPSEKEEFDRSVMALLARNQFLEIIEEARANEQLTKQELAERAGLDPASVRRLLTSKTANPTSDTIVKLLSALHVKLVAEIPDGKKFSIV